MKELAYGMCLKKRIEARYAMCKYCHSVGFTHYIVEARVGYFIYACKGCVARLLSDLFGGEERAIHEIR